jgi:hypothetical protein
MEDKKALKILVEAYWSSNGWKNGVINTEDFSYAKHKGFMFDPIEISHDELINKINSLVAELNILDLSNAFLFSLSTRKLEYRSAIGSFVIAKSMPLHTFGQVLNNKFCGICGEYEHIKIDRNVLNFERYKWGGVRHLSPEYILFDLTQFRNLPPVTPTEGDYRILSEIIELIYELDDNAKARDLEKSLSKVLKSNKSEREILIQILSYCSILEDPVFPGFIVKYTNYIERPDPSEHKNDWCYPSFKWKGSNSINKNALNTVFPSYHSG